MEREKPAVGEIWESTIGSKYEVLAVDGEWQTLLRNLQSDTVDDGRYRMQNYDYKRLGGPPVPTRGAVMGERMHGTHTCPVGCLVCGEPFEVIRIGAGRNWLFLCDKHGADPLDKSIDLWTEWKAGARDFPRQGTQLASPVAVATEDTAPVAASGELSTWEKIVNGAQLPPAVEIKSRQWGKAATSRDSVPRCGHRHTGYGLVCTRDQGHDGRHGNKVTSWPRDPEVVKLAPVEPMLCAAVRVNAVGAVAGVCFNRVAHSQATFCEQHIHELMLEADKESAAKSGPRFLEGRQSHSTSFGGIWSLHSPAAAPKESP